MVSSDVVDKYVPPVWGGVQQCGSLPDAMDLLATKDGVIVDVTPLWNSQNPSSSKGYLLVGRHAEACDVLAEHPSVSKVHGVLQVGSNPTLCQRAHQRLASIDQLKEGTTKKDDEEEEKDDDDSITNVFFQDFGSTNGSFLRGHGMTGERALANTWYPIYRDTVLQVGQSTRRYQIVFKKATPANEPPSTSRAASSLPSPAIEHGEGSAAPQQRVRESFLKRLREESAEEGDGMLRYSHRLNRDLADEDECGPSSAAVSNNSLESLRSRRQQILAALEEDDAQLESLRDELRLIEASISAQSQNAGATTSVVGVVPFREEDE